ncbi:1833_t:CDS:2, partial [Gigaspora rosea]
IKEVTLNMAWSKLEKEDRSLLTKEALGKIVFGSSTEDKRQTRVNIIRGLITQDNSNSILNKLERLKTLESNKEKGSKAPSLQEYKAKKLHKKSSTSEISMKERKKSSYGLMRWKVGSNW